MANILDQQEADNKRFKELYARYYKYDGKLGLADRIKLERKANRLTQEELGNRVDVERQTIGCWEKGTSIPNTNQLIRMCAVFGCDWGYLLGEYDMRTREATDIHAYTGLCEEAIEALHGRLHGDYNGYHINGKDVIPVINHLLTNECAHDMFANMLEYITKSIVYRQRQQTSSIPNDGLSEEEQIYASLGNAKINSDLQKELSAIRYEMICQQDKIMDEVIERFIMEGDNGEQS